MYYFNSSKSNPWTIIKRLLPYLWVKEWGLRLRVIVSVFLIILTMGLNISVPLLLRKIIEVLTEFSNSPLSYIHFLLLAYGISWLASQVISRLREIILFRVMERGIHLFSLELFDHLFKLSLRFHLDRRTGAITSILEKAQDSFPDIFWGLFLFIGPTVFEILIAVTILWYFYGSMYGLILLAILISYTIFSMISLEWSAKIQRISNEKHFNAQARIVDSLLNYETVKYFCNEKYEYKQANKLLQEEEDASTKKHVTSETVNIGQQVVIGIGLIVMTWITGNNVVKGSMNVGDFVLINGYLLQFVQPLSWFGYFLRKIRKGVTNMENIFTIIDLEPEIVNVPNPLILKTQHATIKFDHVSFGYEEDRLILNDVSFEVPAGKCVALVGATGSGKSTISRLLFRFYDVSKGSILINNYNINDISQESLRKLFGIVPQDTVLFNNTLYYNIAYGKPGATPEEVTHAAHLAHLDSFISKLPDGFNTPVGERGLKLSGGEKQRIALARVILKKPVIYIFDEATSALDTRTEREIQKNLEEVSQGSTTLIIAHRLSTVTHADEIIVLEHGVIVEKGTHQELLERDSIYARLWRKQQVTQTDDSEI